MLPATDKIRYFAFPLGSFQSFRAAFFSNWVFEAEGRNLDCSHREVNKTRVVLFSPFDLLNPGLHFTRHVIVVGSFFPFSSYIIPSVTRKQVMGDVRKGICLRR